MTQEPNKPEWFEIAASDNASAAVTKVDKKLTVLAALVAGGIIAVGAFFANATESTPAKAESVSPIAAATAAAASPSTSSTTPGGTTAPSGVENPSQSGIQAPKGGDEDHEFGEHHDHDGDHEGREHHERGEHHEDRDHGDD